MFQYRSLRPCVRYENYKTLLLCSKRGAPGSRGSTGLMRLKNPINEAIRFVFLALSALLVQEITKPTRQFDRYHKLNGPFKVRISDTQAISFLSPSWVSKRNVRLGEITE